MDRYRWMDGWMYIHIDIVMDIDIDGWMDIHIDIVMDIDIDGWMDGWMNG
jgi:hypothetical protein